ncbi:hypothetical protein N7462_006400 [Penicillium macrosclerotiorum]|uniref:uncharacterized protein n=1 Tax=Penicillium macrosclerotiorum TaxID=303699 RepID=UPI002549B8DF|nr:uncharacterized protein N7462_006400 [Penicillium macrosclerotiorum]KAJ5683235.1 hypothetical protein N7462_006400 [Penicillium macrosclerotiorum]
MSSAYSSLQSSSARLNSQEAPARNRGSSNTAPAKSDVTHYLYFEDNDSFFPPPWLGKEKASAERRSSSDSTTSHGSKD